MKCDIMTMVVNGPVDSILRLVHDCDTYEEYCMRSDLIGIEKLTERGYHSDKRWIDAEIEKYNNKCKKRAYRKPVIIARSHASGI